MIANLMGAHNLGRYDIFHLYGMMYSTDLIRSTNRGCLDTQSPRRKAGEVVRVQIGCILVLAGTTNFNLFY
jgi:hypothetical protein